MVDFVRSCYKTTWRISTDLTVPPVPITWYFAEPDAEFLPFPTAFCSSNWDYSALDGPYALGEDRLGARVYSKGANLWGFPGKCTVGSANDFLNGINAEEYNNPQPLPGCCQPPFAAIFYLRSDENPPQPNLPSGWQGNWDTVTEPGRPLLLDTIPGTGGIWNQFGITFTPPGSNTRVGRAQYFSAPLPGQTIGSAVWSIGTGKSIFVRGLWRAYVSYYFALVDGNTNRVKQVLIANGQNGAFLVVNTARSTAFSQFNPGDLVINDGDYFCLEIGFNITSEDGNPLVIFEEVGDCGTIAITADQVPTEEPQSFIGIVPPVPPPPLGFLNEQCGEPAGFVLNGQPASPGPGLWALFEGTWTVNGGFVTDGPIGTGQDMLLSDLLHADCQLSAMVSAQGFGPFTFNGLAFRAVDLNNSLWLLIFATGPTTWQLWFGGVIAGVQFVLQTAPISPIPASPFELGVDMVGSTFNFFIDGVLVMGPVTQTQFQTATLAGLVTLSGSGSVPWSFNEIVASPP